MAKRKNTISKHDIIRAVKDINSRVMYLDSMLSSLGEMFRSYLDFMGNEDDYIEFMEKKEEDTGSDKSNAKVEKIDEED